MMIRGLFTIVALGTVTACAQSQHDEAQQTQLPPVEQAEQPRQTAFACWIRGDAAGVAQRESAFDSAMTSVAGSTVKVCYSRPRMKGRTIMGGLVPYDQPWRLGANEATTIQMPTAGTIVGVSVEAGSYSLYVIPTANQWSVHVNRSAERWGVPINDAVRSSDVRTGTVVPEALTEPIEELTARFEDGATAQSADLVFEWERTRVRIPVTLAAI
jgi:hypothetical protein